MVFGGIRTNVTIAYPLGTPNSPNTDYGYTGQRNLDEDIGLMDYKARFYSPVLNRFIQPDTIVPHPFNSQSHNRYSYVYNNPIIFNDPTGHEICAEGTSFCFNQNDNTTSGSLSGSGCTSCWSTEEDEEVIEEDDEIINLLIDIWNEFGEAGVVFFSNGCDRSFSKFWTTAECLDSFSLVTQDVATLFSSLGATAALSLVAVGCAAPADLQLGCGVGYILGVGIHTTFFNGQETVGSTASFITTIQSDLITGDTYFNSLHDWDFGEDTKTGIMSFLPGLISTDPFIDVGADIYASGYNHGYFCGASTILDCLP